MTPDRKQKDEQLQQYSEDDLVRLFLKFGSIENILENFPNIPMSYVTYQRMISNKGIVKSPAGRPRVHFGALTDFFQTAIAENCSVAELNRYPIKGFTYANSTLFRVLKRVRNGEISHNATALLIQPIYRPDLILVGRDQCFNTIDLDHTSTVPVTYSSSGERPYESVLRVLQQEVFSEMAVNGDLDMSKSFTYRLLKDSLRPIFNIDVLDVRVAVHRLYVPDALFPCFSSERLDNFRFESVDRIARENPISSEYRAGVVECAGKIKLHEDKTSEGKYYQSEVNTQLCFVS